MKLVILGIIISLAASALLMVIHELFKAVVYMVIRGHKQSGSINKKGIWRIFRYIDPLGLVLGVTCYVPVSKPFMFRIRDRKTNLIIGLNGFLIIAAVFFGSTGMIHLIYGGSAGMLDSYNRDTIGMAGVLFWKYMQMLSFDYFVVNLFPVSTFDMGLVIAGVSSRLYLGIIKGDTAIKLILILTLILNLINTGYLRFVSGLIAGI